MKRVIIDPLTRVEGHGRVELLLRNGRLDDVRVRMLESPRLFEKIVVGRKYDEVADLVCRICAICSAVHKLTALEAVERALDVRVPPLAAWIRELLLLGGHIQSHALHLFCLVLPDFSGTESVIDLLRQDDTLAADGLKLKGFGNRLQEVAGGRVIHPVNPVAGGVRFRPERPLLRELLVELETWRKQWPACVREFLARASYPAGQAVTAVPLATGRADMFSLQGDLLWRGGEEVLQARDYAKFLVERSIADSYAKESCADGDACFVGAAARAWLAAARSEGQETRTDSVYHNNTAQLDEIGWALGRACELTEKILGAADGEVMLTRPGLPQGGVGTAVMEAPRGLLVHHYVIDEWGQVAAADVVTPTAINQRAMQAQILADLAEETDPERMRPVAERIVRAFDPCISCAVHLLEI